MNGARLGSYDPIKRTLTHLFDTTGNNTLINMVAGACSGILGSFFGSPFFLVKTRLQSFSDGGVGVGYQHAYLQGKNKMWRGLVHIFKREGGVRGLYAGAETAMMRTAIASAAQLATYDAAKNGLKRTFGYEEGLRLYMLASVVTAAVVGVVMNPMDVATTRMYNQMRQGKGEGALYKGPVDCLVKTVQSEGLRGLMKGVGAQYLRLAPHTILTLVFLEQTRNALSRHLL
jgi:solute carrier family 25 protein 34/35